MAAVSQKIANLVGGVSQQPDTIKFSNNLRSCDNYYPDFTSGLAKRPGLQGIKKLSNAVDDGTWFYLFRDNQEKYIVQFSKAGALKIWNANTGIQQTVNAVPAESTAYAVHTADEDLTTLQINDYTFVLNRTKKVVAAATTSPAYLPFGFVNINTIAFNTKYTITLDAAVFEYTTPNNASGTNPVSVKTIADELVLLINANVSFTSSVIGNTIFIRRVNNADFNLKAAGGTTGAAIEGFKEIVTSVAQLPREFISGRRIKVEGSAESTSDNYWVEFIPATTGQTSGAGHWQETIAPNTVLGMDTTTLPHVIIREANGSFTYRQLDEPSAGPNTTTVTGIPQTVTIASALTTGHVVGERFNVTGGTGSNLSLVVSAVRTDTTTSIYDASSNSFVRKSGKQYLYFKGGIQIGKTKETVSSLVIGNITYSVDGTFEKLLVFPNQLRADLKEVTTFEGRINAVRLDVPCPATGYTNGDVVTSPAGDTFSVATAGSQVRNADIVSVKYWKNRLVGDVETNPMPSFVDSTIDGISFFKNRLIFTSRQNVICSEAGDYFNFFASTVITILNSDPIDISASSLRPIRLKHMLPVPTGLLLFGDDAQYVLETKTEAFAPNTAEVNLLSAYSLNASIPPIDIGPSYIFLEEGAKATAIYEMSVADNVGNKPVVAELTRIIPSYIPAAINELKVSQSANTFALLSRQDLKSIYFYRFFNSGDTRYSAWFRWILPGNVETFDFDQDIMYIVTKQNSDYILSKVSLLTETPSESLFFEDQYLDVRLDLFDYNPTKVYKSATDTTRVCFKEGFNNSEEQAVVMYLDPAIAGSFEEQTIQYDAAAPTGEKYYLEVDGNQTTSKFALGYKYEATAELPAFYYVKAEGNKDTLNIPRINRLKVNSYNSGPYRALVTSEGRDDFSLSLPQINADYYRADNIPIVRNAQSTVPILAKGDQFNISLIADSPFPTAFTSLTWEGTYNNKGIQSL